MNESHTQARSNTHPFFQLGHLDLDRLGLLAALKHVETCLVLDNLTKQIRKQLFVIFGLSKVLSKALQQKKKVSYKNEDAQNHIPVATSF